MIHTFATPTKQTFGHIYTIFHQHSGDVHASLPIISLRSGQYDIYCADYLIDAFIGMFYMNMVDGISHQIISRGLI